MSQWGSENRPYEDEMNYHDERGKNLVSWVLVLQFFGGNERKAWNWWKTPNILLGGISPSDMVMAGQERKLGKFLRIQHQLRDNEKQRRAREGDEGERGNDHGDN